MPTLVCKKALGPKVISGATYSEPSPLPSLKNCFTAGGIDGVLPYNCLKYPSNVGAPDCSSNLAFTSSINLPFVSLKENFKLPFSSGLSTLDVETVCLLLSDFINIFL